MNSFIKKKKKKKLKKEKERNRSLLIFIAKKVVSTVAQQVSSI
jgi:hypothetical protein